MRLLVTGASGFIGGALLQALDGQAELCATARRGGGDRDGRVRWFDCDLLDEGAAEALIERCRPDILVHAAWHTRPGSYWEDRENADWVAASERLLTAFVAAGGRRFVGIGSCAEYAATTEACHETRTPLAAASAYGAAKSAFFRRLDAERQAGRIETAHARLFFVYGPGEKPTRLIPSLIARLLAGEPAETGPGALRRDFTHIRDVARALARLAGSRVTGPINIGSGRAARIDAIAVRLGDLTRRADLLRIGARPARAGEPALIRADTTRMLGELGCRPEVSLSQGLHEAVDWWRNVLETR